MITAKSHLVVNRCTILTTAPLSASRRRLHNDVVSNESVESQDKWKTRDIPGKHITSSGAGAKVVLMLVHRLRRCTSIKTTSAQCLWVISVTLHTISHYWFGGLHWQQPPTLCWSRLLHVAQLQQIIDKRQVGGHTNTGRQTDRLTNRQTGRLQRQACRQTDSARFISVKYWLDIIKCKGIRLNHVGLVKIRNLIILYKCYTTIRASGWKRVPSIVCL